MLVMRSSLLGLVLATRSVHAIFDSFYFAGSGQDASAPRVCGDMPYSCDAPGMCSRDSVTKKLYRCQPGSSDSVCWKGRDTYMGSDSRTASDQQLGCLYKLPSGDVRWCCGKEEACTSYESKHL